MLDRKAFDNMLQSAESDKTMATLFKQEKKDTKKDLHNTLMLAGFAPAYGNIADAADALLYAAEGEFGEAALSGASAIPIIGQFVAGKRALKAAKEAGEEMVTLYRGSDKWHKGLMVNKGKFMGGSPLKKRHFESLEEIGVKLPYKDNIHGLWTTSNRMEAKRYTEPASWNKWNEEGKGIVLEFEVPKSFLKKSGIQTQIGYDTARRTISDNYLFMQGIPKEFLKKVHK